MDDTPSPEASVLTGDLLRDVENTAKPKSNTEQKPTMGSSTTRMAQVASQEHLKTQIQDQVFVMRGQFTASPRNDGSQTSACGTETDGKR